MVESVAVLMHATVKVGTYTAQFSQKTWHGFAPTRSDRQTQSEHTI